MLLLHLLPLLAPAYTATIIESPSRPSEVNLSADGTVFYRLADGWHSFAGGKHQALGYENLLLDVSGVPNELRFTTDGFVVASGETKAERRHNLEPRFKDGDRVYGMGKSKANLRPWVSTLEGARELPLDPDWTSTPGERDAVLLAVAEGHAGGWYRWKKKEGEFYLPILWKGYEILETPLPEGFHHGRIAAVNKNSQAAGAVSAAPANAAFLWNPTAVSSPKWQAAAWADGKVKVLPSFYWGDASLPRNIAESTTANAINSAGLIAGSSSWVSTVYAASPRTDIPRARATLWQSGKAVDLSKSGPPGYTLTTVARMNDKGQMLCWGVNQQGAWKPVLLTP